MEEMNLEIQDMLTILKRHWKVIAGITVVVTIFVAIMSFFIIKPVYEVNTKVFIGKEETKNTEYNNNDVQMYQKLLKTYSELIKTKDLIENATNENNLDVPYLEVMDVLKISPMTDTQILEISYQNKDKELAKDVLVAVTEEFIKESKELIPNGTVKIIESAELPQESVSPNKKINISIACLVGFIMGIVIAFFMEYMDDTLKTKEQTEKIMELSVLGMIPCGEKN